MFVSRALRGLAGGWPSIVKVVYAFPVLARVKTKETFLTHLSPGRNPFLFCIILFDFEAIYILAFFWEHVKSHQHKLKQINHVRKPDTTSRKYKSRPPKVFGRYFA